MLRLHEIGPDLGMLVGPAQHSLLQADPIHFCHVPGSQDIPRWRLLDFGLIPLWPWFGRAYALGLLSRSIREHYRHHSTNSLGVTPR